jgi:hypothetical protein
MTRMHSFWQGFEKRAATSTAYEIPGLAGYSEDGKIIYIDKRLPKKIELGNGKTMSAHKYLNVHERVEKGLIDSKGYKYQYAHRLATGAERKAVEADGYSWDDYQPYMLRMVKKLETYSGRLPKDLDLTPQRNRGAYAEIRKIKKLQQKTTRR